MGSFFGNGCYGVKAQNTARWWHDPLWGAQLFKFCVWSLATLMSVWEGWTNLFDLGIVEGESTDHKLVLGFVFYRDGAVVVQLKYFSAGKGKKAHDSFQDAAFIYIYIIYICTGLKYRFGITWTPAPTSSAAFHCIDLESQTTGRRVCSPRSHNSGQNTHTHTMEKNSKRVKTTMS